jgi:hypothetical protein
MFFLQNFKKFATFLSLLVLRFNDTLGRQDCIIYVTKGLIRHMR